jgi:osmotically-inducible protein OsmY
MVRTRIGSQFQALLMFSVLAEAGLLCACRTRSPAQLIETKTERPAATREDLLIARRIRQALAADRQLSEAAHRVQILVHDGQVILHGPVRSEMEVRTVVDTAVQVVGDPRKVANELTLKY